MSLSRRDFLAASAVTPVAVALGRSNARHPWQARPAAPINAVFTPIRRDVGYFTGRGGTIGYLINKDAVVVVDSQFPDSAQLCINGLQERSKNRGVDLLVNTHHHGDHTNGNPTFKGVTKRILANARAVELQKQVYQTAVKNAADKGAAAPAEIVVADRIFIDSWSEKMGGEDLTAKTYTPAHTSGDAIVVFEKANVVHMGDLLWNRAHPVIDRAAGASIANWIKMLDAISKAHSKDTIFIAGHSGGADVPVICKQAELTTMRNYLGALLAFTNVQVKAGKPREDVIAMKDVLTGFEDFGPLLARTLGPAFDEIKEGR
jgi:glyoxylase-like metal-dependent hydrolase (beta-lactamase superfamily II)